MTKSAARGQALLLEPLRAAARRCLAPSPRTRRLAEMSSSSMIFCGANLADPGQRLEHVGYLHLADGVVLTLQDVPSA